MFLVQIRLAEVPLLQHNLDYQPYPAEMNAKKSAINSVTECPHLQYNLHGKRMPTPLNHRSFPWPIERFDIASCRTPYAIPLENCKRKCIKLKFTAKFDVRNGTHTCDHRLNLRFRSYHFDPSENAAAKIHRFHSMGHRLSLADHQNQLISSL